MLIIEFWENDKQVAECSTDEIINLDRKKWADFWYVQDIRNREIRLRIEDNNDPDRD